MVMLPDQVFECFDLGLGAGDWDAWKREYGLRQRLQTMRTASVVWPCVTTA